MAPKAPRRADSKGVAQLVPKRPPSQEVAITEKRAQALEYRRDGYSYRDIALIMNSTVSTVYYWIQAELHALRDLTVEQAEDVRDMELQRLDMMLNNLMPGIKQGDPSCVAVAIRVGERRSKLLGLDAAQKIDARGAFMNLTTEEVSKMSDADINAAIQNLIMTAGASRLALPETPDGTE